MWKSLPVLLSVTAAAAAATAAVTVLPNGCDSGALGIDRQARNGPRQSISLVVAGSDNAQECLIFLLAPRPPELV